LGEPYYTIGEAAGILGVSPATVWRWISAGRLRAHRVGARKIRIRVEDVGMVIRPIRAGKPAEASDLWTVYDPEAVLKALDETAGAWADLDVERVIADLYRARRKGTRPAGRR
jgi:excisionase family DNA binding protein